MPRPSSTLRLGDRVPSLELRDAVSDSTFDLDSLLANHRGLLLVFHRGMWCPNCRRQLAELEQALPSLQTAGIRVAAVLAQAWYRVRVSLEKLAEPYRFPILCDGDRKVIKAYGVWHPLGIDASTAPIRHRFSSIPTACSATASSAARSSSAHR